MYPPVGYPVSTLWVPEKIQVSVEYPIGYPGSVLPGYGSHICEESNQQPFNRESGAVTVAPSSRTKIITAMFYYFLHLQDHD